MNTIISIINVVFSIYVYILLARVILSWIPHNPQNPIIKFVYEITQPVLGLFQRLIPTMGGFDFSPIIAFFALDIVKIILIRLLEWIF
ncbi:MAG: YggT family protein [Clostridia bacterium]|nr:YggT family protein [Clostridia bacterium]